MDQLTSPAPFWQRSHHLGRMDLADLVRAYFSHYAVIVYLALTAACLIAFARWPAAAIPTVAT